MYVYSVGKSDKQEKVFEQFVKKIKRYDVISFDIFDTFLIRLCARPQDVFKKMGNKASEIGVSDFVGKRIFAAKSAAQKRGTKLSINDIYNELALQCNLSREKIQNLIELEIQTEISICLPNATVIEIIKELNKCGKTVIFTSDMYIPKDGIKKILDSFQLQIKYDAIYVSCDVGRTKAEGSLFDYVAEKYPQKKIIHIGDNFKSDVMMAYKNQGFKAVFMPRRPNKESMFDKFLKYSIPDNSTYIERWAYKELAPVLWEFCSWLHSGAKQADCQTMLFLTREGAFLKELYDLFPCEDKCKAHIFFASRSSLLCASSDINWKWVKQTFGPSTVDHLLERFHIEKSFIEDCERKRKVKDWENIDAIKSQCAIYSQKQRKLLLKLLNNFGALEGNIGIVDVGWKGSSQLFLQNILQSENKNIKIYGFYIGEFPEKGYEEIEKQGYVCSSKNTVYKEAVLNAGFIFENILSPDFGTTIGYIERKGEVVPILDTTNVLKNSNIIIAQKAIKNFFKNMSKYKEFVEFDRKVILDKMFHHLNYPSYHFACILGNIEWRDFVDVRYVAKPQSFLKYLTNPKRFLYDIRYCGWNSAFCLRTFKIPFPYFEIYKRARRYFK